MVNKNLLEQSYEIFNSYYVNYSRFGGTKPKNYKLITLNEIVDFSNGYPFKGNELLNKPTGDCYQVFKQGHINRGGGFIVDGTKSWYPKNQAKDLSKYILKKGDVLMAMTDMKGNVAILGNTALMIFDSEYIVNQRVALLRSNNQYNTSYSYLYLLTNSYDFVKDLRSRANSGVQVNLSSNEIKNSSFYIAPDDINKEFNNIVSPMINLIMSNDIENINLSKMRDYYLQFYHQYLIKLKQFYLDILLEVHQYHNF